MEFNEQELQKHIDYLNQRGLRDKYFFENDEEEYLPVH